MAKFNHNRPGRKALRQSNRTRYDFGSGSVEYTTNQPIPLSEAGEDYGRTPLMEAVRTNDETLVAKLLSQGADPNETDINGETALFYAVNQQNPRLVKKLVHAGAIIEQHNHRGKTPLNLTKKGGKIFNYLKRKVQAQNAAARDDEPQFSFEHTQPMLTNAIEYGSIDTIDKIGIVKNTLGINFVVMGYPLNPAQIELLTPNGEIKNLNADLFSEELDLPKELWAKQLTPEQIQTLTTNLRRRQSAPTG